jgi:drug/metabolite transporter (DMT)-like permease
VADLSLLLLTFLWGTTFLLVNRTLLGVSAGVFLALRFALATLLTGLAWLIRRDRPTPGLLRDSALLGSAMFAGFALQTEGLRFTTPARSAFLTGMSVLFVPLIERFVLGRPVARGAWLGVLLAVTGLVILTDPFGDGVTRDVRLGDALTLACAFAFSLQILWTGRFSARHPLALLTTLQLGVCAIGAAAALLSGELWLGRAHIEATPGFALVLAYTGGVMTTGAFLVQNWAQRHTTATRAAVIFVLEPVFAALISHLVGGEDLGVGLLAGGSLIVAGVLVTELTRA